MPSKTSVNYASDLEVVRSMKDRDKESYEYPWLNVQATENSEEKIKKVYDVSKKYNIPPAILYGAIAQESSWMEMGLADDFGNWACGLAQLNVNDWCNWSENADALTKAKIKWPVKEIQAYRSQHPGANICDTSFITPSYAGPFYEVALKRLRSEDPDAPPYMLRSRHASEPRLPNYLEIMAGYRFVAKYSIDDRISKNDPHAQGLRYLITSSFAANCSDYHNGIDAAAFTFAEIFKQLPQELQQAQKYKKGLENPNNCAQNTSNYYPLHVGWLLANAVYNAGPEILPGVFKYQQNSRISWENFTPEDLVKAIHFAVIQKNSGISSTGAQEAMGHVPGVLNSTSFENKEDADE